MTKRLVVCCDGTWNTPDQRQQCPDPDTGLRHMATPSNVTKIALAVAPSNAAGVEQRTFYDRGVGTGPFDRWRGGAVGIGLSERIQQAYLYLVENYDVGDEVFLFGFSRGAYTARSTVGLIRNAGLLRREYVHKLDQAYELYRDRSDTTHPRASEAALFRKSFAREIRIKCLGVWDTVGALGIPNLEGIHLLASRWKFHDVTLSSWVDNAFQALAIDERRKPFEATLWEQQREATTQRLEQVWFSGSHADVGGGYCESGLSDLALAWMMERASECGLTFLEDERASLCPDPLGVLHDSMTWYYRLLGERVRPIAEPRVDDAGKSVATCESVAPSALRRLSEDRSYQPRNLTEFLDRTNLVLTPSA